MGPSLPPPWEEKLASPIPKSPRCSSPTVTRVALAPMPVSRHSFHLWKCHKIWHRLWPGHTCTAPLAQCRNTKVILNSSLTQQALFYLPERKLLWKRRRKEEKEEKEEEEKEKEKEEKEKTTHPPTYHWSPALWRQVYPYGTENETCLCWRRHQSWASWRAFMLPICFLVSFQIKCPHTTNQTWQTHSKSWQTFLPEASSHVFWLLSSMFKVLDSSTEFYQCGTHFS